MTSEDMGRRGEKRDTTLHNNINPQQKAASEKQKLYGSVAISYYSSLSTPEESKHCQQQSKLQAALKNAKEHEDTYFYLLLAKTLNLLIWQIKQQITDRTAPSGFTARLKASKKI